MRERASKELKRKNVFIKIMGYVDTSRTEMNSNETKNKIIHEEYCCEGGIYQSGTDKLKGKSFVDMYNKYNFLTDW